MNAHLDPPGRYVLTQILKLAEKTMKENRKLRSRVNRMGLTGVEMHMVRQRQNDKVVRKLVREGFNPRTAKCLVNAYHRDIRYY